MRYVAEQGFPVPRVHEVSPDGTELVMERIEGMTMINALAREPWTLARHGATLARLHRELHELAAPEWLGPFAPAPGDRVGHFDLHPMNVMLSPSGPVVIDWNNAAATRPAVDVAMTWALLAAGQVEGGRSRRVLVRLARQRLIHAFLRTFDRAEVGAELSTVIDYKCHDAHLSATEVAAARALAARWTRS